MVGKLGLGIDKQKVAEDRNSIAFPFFGGIVDFSESIDIVVTNYYTVE